MFKVYEKEKDEKPIYLKLSNGEDGRVSLNIVDRNGSKIHNGTLLYVDAEGLHLAKDINPSTGIILRRGRINLCDLDWLYKELCDGCNLGES